MNDGKPTIWQQMADSEQLVGGALRDRDTDLGPVPWTRITEVKVEESAGTHYFAVIGEDYTCRCKTGPDTFGALSVGPRAGGGFVFASMYMAFEVIPPGPAADAALTGASAEGAPEWEAQIEPEQGASLCFAHDETVEKQDGQCPLCAAEDDA